MRCDIKKRRREKEKESDDYDDVRHLSLKKSVCDKSSLGAEKKDALS